MNPFENPQVQHLVLTNQEGQYSLWPDFREKPLGWESVYGPRSRADCLNYIEENWIDMRPKSLVRDSTAACSN
jgi:MbtH protein